MTKEFGEWLATLRHNSHQSQEVVADKIGVHLNTVSNWETGRTVPPADAFLHYLAACNVTMIKVSGVAAMFWKNAEERS